MDNRERLERKHGKSMVHAINKDYRLIYLNEEMKRVFPGIRLGDVCYSSMYGYSEPCMDCICRSVAGEECEELIGVTYNPRVKQWMQTSAVVMRQDDARREIVVGMHPMDELETPHFYDPSMIRAYDECVRINLDRKTLEVLYRKNDQYVSPVWGEQESEARIRKADTWIHPDDLEAYRELWDMDTLWERLGENDGTVSAVFRRKLSEGGYIWTNRVVTRLDGDASGERIVMCYVQDIQEQKEISIEDEKRRKRIIQRMGKASGLCARPEFKQQMKACLQREPEKEWHMLALGVDGFSHFEEWYGGEKAEDFLVHLAEFVYRQKEKACGIGGYFGGDSFAMLLPGNGYREESMETELLEWSEQYELATGFYPVVGVYPVEETPIHQQVIYERAMLAQQLVRETHSGRIGHYRIPESYKNRVDAAVQVKQIETALAQGDIFIYYQPQCDMVSGKIIGAEALCRWRNPEGKVESIGRMIPALEESGFISQVDMFVWRTVCAAQRRWIDEGKKVLPVSVNISREDIYRYNLPAVFEDLVKEFDLEPSLILLEVTESTYAKNYERLKQTIKKLRSAGFIIYMDDFGSAYSSLNMLKDVDVDVLKLDMHFLDALDDKRSRSADIIEAVIYLARWMRLRVVAEGVETKEQKEFLTAIGCEYGQGYYFYHPLPEETYERMLERTEQIDQQSFGKEGQTVMKNYRATFAELSGGIILNKLLDGIVILEYEKGTLRLLQASEKFTQIAGRAFAATDGQAVNMLEHLRERDRDELVQRIEDGELDEPNGLHMICEYSVMEDEKVWMEMQLYHLREEDGIQWMYGTLTNVTERIARQRELQRRAHREPLTGLYNRTTAQEKINTKLRKLLSEGKQGAFFILDFDNFKGINDQFGHAYGDAVLVEEADRIRQMFRREDVICRLGGDEFIIFLSNAKEDTVRRKAGDLCREMQRTFEMEGKALNISVSLGVAMAPRDGEDFEELYRNADQALYMVKAAGKHGYRIYEQSDSSKNP